MNGQMTIFEFLPQEADFATMPEARVMEIISQRIGVNLVYDNHLEEYAAMVGKVKISAEISTYSCTHEGSETLIAGHKFISVGWSMSTEGGGGPKDSIDDAVSYLQSIISQHGRKRG